MKINKIVLCNLGSYEGLNTITIQSDNNKNIVLIGGKNGAGKTTLFESIRLCLYGYKAFGYQVMGSAYKRHILKIINDSAKMAKNINAYVALELEIKNEQEIDNFTLKRSWSLETNEFEFFEVYKNGVQLFDDSIDDFSSFLMSLLPPSLFDLYFFDGEQIAEHFLSDDGGENLRKAFLTLCGYDTFEILLDNFKRLVKTKKTTSFASDYVRTKELNENLQRENELLVRKKDELQKRLHDVDAQIMSIDKSFSNKGGITEDEWYKKVKELKAQEVLREELNSEIKKLANDVIPLIILKKQLKQLSVQLEREGDFSSNKVIINQIVENIPLIMKQASKDADFSLPEKQLELLSIRVADILKQSSMHDVPSQILNLSLSERNQLQEQVFNSLKLDSSIVIQNRKKLKESKESSKCLREELEQCPIKYIQQYQEKRKCLEEEKVEIQKNLEICIEDESDLAARLQESSAEYLKAERLFDSELKQNSVIDLSSRAVIFIERLLSTLVKTKAKQVEESFICKLNELKQKDSFISRIRIDEKFFIHAYKMIEDNRGRFVEQEIDKTRLSKGEKQVFIMALYWALMSLSRTEIPFMIDTPFARIDSNHRERITVKFFEELPGQVFIFSTDEEIVGVNLELINEKIGTKLLLENKDNNRTTIIPNRYFEV